MGISQLAMLVYWTALLASMEKTVETVYVGLQRHMRNRYSSEIKAFEKGIGTE